MVHPGDPVTNYKIVSAIRQEVAEKMDTGSLQEILADRWCPYLENSHVCMTDATCYESCMRYPTDIKVLWECVEWLNRHLCKDCRSLRIRRMRNKYDDVSRAWLAYSKKRKRKSSRTRMLKRRLLHLPEKLLSQTGWLHKTYKARLRHTGGYYRRLSVIRKVLKQGRLLFDGHKVSERIVSVDRHYVRPIVRGKETKAVEFGAKVNHI